MKRYYLSKIEFVDEGGMQFYRHRIQAYPDVLYAGGEIATGPDGRPTQPALLVLVDVPDHGVFAADAGLVPLPLMPAAAKIAATQLSEKSAFIDGAIALGFAAGDVADVMDNADGWGDVLNYFGQRNNPAFSYLAFDV